MVGGGAHIWDDGRKQARLTGLSPTTAGTFIATAETPGLTASYEWKLRAYAICADKTSLRDYSIEFASENSKDTFKETPAECPDGTVAYGAGASVFAPYGPGGNGAGAGRIGLQLYRTDGALGISRATARADSLYRENWTLTSQVICADRSGTLQAEGTVAAGAEAEHTCTQGRKVHGIGGGGGITDGGLVHLRKIYPLGDLSGVQVALTGTLFPSIGGMVASAVCGTASRPLWRVPPQSYFAPRSGRPRMAAAPSSTSILNARARSPPAEPLLPCWLGLCGRPGTRPASPSLRPRWPACRHRCAAGLTGPRSGSCQKTSHSPSARTFGGWPPSRPWRPRWRRSLTWSRFPTAIALQADLDPDHALHDALLISRSAAGAIGAVLGSGARRRPPRVPPRRGTRRSSRRIDDDSGGAAHRASTGPEPLGARSSVLRRRLRAEQRSVGGEPAAVAREAAHHLGQHLASDEGGLRRLAGVDPVVGLVEIAD